MTNRIACAGDCGRTVRAGVGVSPYCRKCRRAMAREDAREEYRKRRAKKTKAPSYISMKERYDSQEKKAPKFQPFTTWWTARNRRRNKS